MEVRGLNAPFSRIPRKRPPQVLLPRPFAEWVDCNYQKPHTATIVDGTMNNREELGGGGGWWRKDLSFNRKLSRVGVGGRRIALGGSLVTKASLNLLPSGTSAPAR